MSDILITTGSEFMVSRAEGATEAGRDFIDAFLPASGADNLTVLDLGDIIFPDAALDEFRKQADERGLTVDVGKARV
jgi:hypothetical protein